MPVLSSHSSCCPPAWFLLGCPLGMAITGSLPNAPVTVGRSAASVAWPHATSPAATSGMTSSELLIEAFDRIPAQVHDVVEGLTPAQLTFRLDSEANSIAWLVWHMSRIADDHIAEVAHKPQVWTSSGWATRWRLPW